MQESNPEMKARDKVNPIGASLRRLGLTAGLATLWHRGRSWARCQFGAAASDLFSEYFQVHKITLTPKTGLGQALAVLKSCAT